jgi:hypothetical protein
MHKLCTCTTHRSIILCTWKIGLIACISGEVAERAMLHVARPRHAPELEDIAALALAVPITSSLSSVRPVSPYLQDNQLATPAVGALHYSKSLGNTGRELSQNAAGPPPITGRLRRSES